jgi:hypothetical protein
MQFIQTSDVCLNLLYVYKKCIAPVGYELWPLKDIIFNRDSYVLYKFTIKSAYTQNILYYCTLGKPFFK